MTGHDKNGFGSIVKIALALVGLMIGGQGYAACDQSNLTGTWYFNGLSGDASGGDTWETDYCKIKINSSGKILNSGSKCKFRDSDGTDTINVKGGTLTVKASCAITGQIKYGDANLTVSMIIDDAKMDKGKTVIALVARSSINPDVLGYFTGVKK